ncbi:MAG TPA: hypothetical protein VGD27_16150 [Longimicrobiales bacterium]
MTLLLWAAPLLVTALGGAYFLRQRRLHSRRLYKQSLERALADGILTEDETRELASVREEQDLSAAEVRMVALSLYRRALRDAVADSRITEQENEVLQRMRTQLGLSDRDLRDDVAQLQRVRLLAEVEREHLPHVDAPVPLSNGEECHWVVPARIGDRLVTPGRASELRSVNFVVAGETPFSAVGERSELRDSDAILPVDVGLLIITHCRTLFRGARRTIVIPHKKLQSLELFRDGVALEQAEPVQRSFFIVDDPELTTAVLLCAARLRRAHLANLSARTA